VDVKRAAAPLGPRIFEDDLADLRERLSDGSLDDDLEHCRPHDAVQTGLLQGDDADDGPSAVDVEDPKVGAVGLEARAEAGQDGLDPLEWRKMEREMDPGLHR